MKLLILVASVAVMQAAPPIPGKTPDASSHAGQPVQNHAKSNESSTTKTPAAREKSAPEKAQNESAHEGAVSAEHSIVVREPVFVSAIKDWADYLAIFSSFLLFVIGGMGIRYAVKTLSTLQRQTDAIEDQTRSLLAQNRAWLVLESIESPHGFQRNTRMRIFSGYGVIWTIKNTGNSPAFIFRIGSRFHRVNSFSELPATPDIEVPDLLMPTRHYKHGYTLGPGQTLERFIMQENPADRPKTPEDYQAIRQGNPIWLAYGLVEYRTVFDKPDLIRELRFCYRWFAMGEDEFNPSDLPEGYTKQS